MRRIYCLVVLLSTLAFSQNKVEAEKKVNEGIKLHDAGKFEEAIFKYNEALDLDKNNAFALTEKAMSLESVKKFDEAIDICKQILKLYPNEDNRVVYTNYGNALDHSGKPDLALKIYDEGIKKYPNYYQLYYNKGITLYNAKQVEKAIEAFQNSTKLNPNHPSSFNALALLESSNRIASILAASRYLVIDNKSSRAKGNLELLVSQMQKGVAKKNDNSISITVDEKVIDKTNKKKNIENDFSSVDLILSMSTALDFDEKNKDKTNVQKFADKFEIICKSMDETKKKNKGYYWEFLAPYFIEMKKKNLVEPFANIVYVVWNDKNALEYYDKNPEKINEFYKWSDNYQWK